MTIRSLTDDQEISLASRFFAGEGVNTLAAIFGVSYRCAFAAIIRYRKAMLVAGACPELPDDVSAYHWRRIARDPRTNILLDYLHQHGTQSYRALQDALSAQGIHVTQCSLRRLLEWLWLCNELQVTVHKGGHNHPTQWRINAKTIDGARAKVLAYIATGPATPKELSFVTRIPRKEIHELLTRLEAHGEVERVDGGYYHHVCVPDDPPPVTVAAPRTGRPSAVHMIDAPAHASYWEPFLREQMQRLAGRNFVVFRATLDPPVPVPLWAIPPDRFRHALERMDNNERGKYDVMGDRSAYSIALAKSCCSFLRKLCNVRITPDDLPFIISYTDEVAPEYAYEGRLGVVTRQRQIMERS